MPWYRDHRDLPSPDYCRLILYHSLEEVKALEPLTDTDFVIVGSYVPHGCEVGQWVLDTADAQLRFYDIDTPVTLAKLERGDYEYIDPRLIARYDMYLSFPGGPTLRCIEREYGPAAALALLSFDPEIYFPEDRPLD